MRFPCGYLSGKRVSFGRARKVPLTKFVSQRIDEAKEFWTEFRRASRKVPDRLQAAMVELADTGMCQLDEAQAAELRRILGTLPQPASPLITEVPYIRPPFGGGIPMTSGRVIPLSERLGILKELMGAMDLVTLAGRAHVMNKMLILLRREVLSVDPPIAVADVTSLSNAMRELEHEVARLAPTPAVFNRNVAIAIGALGRSGRDALILEHG